MIHQDFPPSHDLYSYQKPLREIQPLTVTYSLCSLYGMLLLPPLKKIWFYHLIKYKYFAVKWYLVKKEMYQNDLFYLADA